MSRGPRSLVLLAAVLALAGAARPARAQQPFNFAYVVSNSYKAGANVRWDLTLALPINEVLDSSDSVDIVVVLPGGTDAAHPGFGVAATPFLSDTVLGLTSPPRYLSSYYTGNPQVGVQLHIIVGPYDGWTQYETVTFKLHDIVNAGTAAPTSFKVYINDLVNGGVRVDTTDVSIDVLTGSLDHYLIGQYSPGDPDAPIPNKAAGEVFSLKVSALDKFGNLVDTTTAVTLSDSTGTLTPTGASLTQAETIVTGASVKKARDVDRIKATDGVHSGFSNAFKVSAGTLSRMRFTSSPASAIANNPFPVSIRAEDLYGNLVTTFTGSVIPSDLTGTISPTLLGPFAGGTFTGNVVIGQAIAADSITATYNSNVKGVSAPFPVVAQVLDHFAFTAPTVATAGTRFLASIRAEDAAGYVVKSFTGTAQLSNDLGGMTPSVSGPFTQGARADSVRLTKAGLDHLHAGDGLGHSGTSAAIAVSSGALARLALSGYPTTVTVSSSFPLTITAVDAYDNAVASATGPAALSDTRGSIDPTSTGTFTAGAWTGPVTLNDTATADVITATLGGKSGQTAGIRVVQPGLARFTVNLAAAGPIVAGTMITLNIQARDADDAIFTSFVGTVTLADSSGTLSPLLSNPFNGGLLTQQVFITKSGPTRITVSDGQGHTGGTATFTLLPGPHAGFQVDVPSQVRRAKQKFPVVIRAVDVNGNVAPAFTGSVALDDLSHTLLPQVTGPFTAGIWNDSVTVGRGYGSDEITVTPVSFPPVQSDTFSVFSAFPKILGATPPVVPPGESAEFTLIGHDFDPLAGLTLGGGVTISNFVVAGPDTMRAHIAVAPNATVGFRLVRVTQFQASDTSTIVFSVNYLPPTLVALAPGTVAAAGHVRARLTGKHFEPGATPSAGSGVTFTNVQVAAPETLYADVAVDAGATLGLRDVLVSAPHGSGSGTGLLRVVARPAITSFQPDSGASGLIVGVNGTGFDPAGPDSVSVDGLLQAATPSADDFAQFTIPEAAAAGIRPVQISSYGAWSAPVNFRVIAPRRGDVNGDGRIEFSDVTTTVNAILVRVNLTGRAFFGADCDGSGALDVLDLLCMVDLGVGEAPGLLDRADLPVAGAAHWDAATGELLPPEGAVAVAWRGAGEPSAAAARNAEGIVSAWAARGASLHGVAALLRPGRIALPRGVRTVTDVAWGDAQGRLFRATLSAAAAPRRFTALGNPQHGELWFGIPAHAGPGSLELFATDGRRVARREVAAGESGALAWTPASRLGAGVYWARFTSGGTRTAVKLLVLP